MTSESNPQVRQLDYFTQVIQPQITLCNRVQTFGSLAEFREAVLALHRDVEPLGDEDFRKDWNDRPCTAHKDPVTGRPIFIPRKRDVSAWLSILMSLLARRQALWRENRSSMATIEG